MAKDELRKECIRLRVKERKSLREIHEITGASKGSLSNWLRPHPLTSAEKNARRTAATPPSTKKPRGDESKFFAWSRGREYTSDQKGHISESAVLFRLSVLGARVFQSTVDGDRADFIVEVGGKFKVVQVKWVYRHSSGHGLPTVRLLRKKGLERYRKGDFDIIVGYDLKTDTAYVFTWKETSGNKSSISTTPESREAWNKIGL